jgi:DnaJ-class molecular chaperone
MTAKEPCPYCDDGIDGFFPGTDHPRPCRECYGTGFVPPIEEYLDPRDAEDWKRHAE